MIAVFFEVQPKPGHVQSYLDIAASLRPELEQINGFISVERFQSLTHEGKYLSVSFFRDEEALTEWRQLQPHKVAQQTGRNNLFEDYRIRVASVIRDYSMFDRAQAPMSGRDIPKD